MGEPVCCNSIVTQGGLDSTPHPCYNASMKKLLRLLPVLPLTAAPLPSTTWGEEDMGKLVAALPPRTAEPIMPAPPSLGGGLGYAGGPLGEQLDAFFGLFYRFKPGQEAARDAFHRNLLSMVPATALRALPRDVQPTPSRCDAACIHLCGEGVWLAHYRDWVVAPASGRFRFIAAGDAVVTIRFQRQVVLEAGKSTPFTVTQGHAYPLEVIISGGQRCTLLVEDMDANPQSGKAAPRYDLLRCALGTAPADSPTHEADSPVWLLERYLYSQGREPVRE